jgi:hypothetical protein
MPLYYTQPTGPAQYYAGNFGTTTEDACPRYGLASNGLTSQRLFLTMFTAANTRTYSTVYTATGGTAAAATPTLCRIGVYTVVGNLATLVASIANDTTLWAATFTAYSRSLSASYATTAGSRYAVGVLCVTGAAAPSLAGASTANNAIQSLAPIVSIGLSGQNDLPSSIADLTSGTTGTPPIYARLS